MAGREAQTNLVVEPQGASLPVLLQSYSFAQLHFPILPAPFKTEDAEVWRYNLAFNWWACIGITARLQLLCK